MSAAVIKECDYQRKLAHVGNYVSSAPVRFPNMTSASRVARPWEAAVPGPTRIPVRACSTPVHTKGTRART